MPPKKRSKGNIEKKAEVKKQKQPKPPETVDDLAREFLILQIKDQEQRIARFQRKCDELVVKHGDYDKIFEQLATDKNEIVSYWKLQVEQKTAEIAELNDQMVSIQQVKDTEKELYDSQLSQLRTEFQETKDQLTSENMILGGKLSSLDEFRVQKEDLMAKFASIRANLEENKVKHRDDVYDLERQTVIDKDKLKKEMLLRVNNLAEEYRQMSNKQMVETTKRTIQENVAMNVVLTKRSNKTVEIIHENEALRERDHVSSMEIEILEKNERVLAKKNRKNLKIIQALTEKCKLQESELSRLELEKNDSVEVEVDHRDFQKRLELASNSVQGSAKKLDALWTEARKLAEMIENEKERRSQIENVLRDTYNAIHYVMQVEKSDDISLCVEARETMLENILILMNSAATLGIGVEPASLRCFFVRKSPTFSGISRKSRNFPSEASKSSPAIGLGGVTSGVKFSDLKKLGLVTRDKMPMDSFIAKVGLLSPTTRLGQLKRVTKKTVSCQTSSIQKTPSKTTPSTSSRENLPILRDLMIHKSSLMNAY